ncbi:MAG: GGDEF domain-containing protein [Gammaproteobacteria bacterium]
MLPKLDPRQRLRLRRFKMALVSYCMWVSLSLFAYFTDQVKISQGMLYVVLGGIALSNLYFYVMIRSGLNRRLGDPAMTLQQLVIAVGWSMVLMLVAPEVRGALMMVYVITILFGIFHLNRRGFFAMTALSLVGYMAVVATDYVLWPQNFNVDRELINLMVLSASLIWCASFGNYVAQLKSTLRQNNIELREAVSSASRMATRDHLTQSFNRRYMMESLSREKARADRSGSTFSLCILDLDHFKDLNDAHGHLVGDRVLTAFAYLARQELRATDVIDLDSEGRCFGRFGGEEFICLLPSTDEEGGLRCAERLREATAEASFEGNLSITLSAGVAEYRHGESIADTLRRSDDALYFAKQTGRNRVECASTMDGPNPPTETRDDKVVRGRFRRSVSS